MRAAAAVVLGLAAATAHANGTHLPDVLDVMLAPGDPTSVTIETNFGLLQSADGGPFHWICHETITPYAGLIPVYTANADGVILGSVRLPAFGTDPVETLYRSSDEGCTWSVTGGLDGAAISSVAFDPANPDHALATAATGGADANAIWASSDAGSTWTKTAIEGDYYVYGVHFSAADPLVVWATAANPTDDVAIVFRSTNGGASFAQAPFTERPSGLALGSMAILATSATDPLTGWLRTYGVTHRLWLTTNGGLGFEQVFETGGSLLDVDVLEDGRTYVATQTSGWFFSTDGRVFTPMGTTPNPRGFAHDDRGVFAATDPYLDPYALILSSSGDLAGGFGLFRFDALAGPKPCPDGSTVKTVCEPLYQALRVRLGLALGRVPEPQGRLAEDRSVGGGSSGCACSTEGARSTQTALLALLALAVLAIRVRRTA